MSPKSAPRRPARASARVAAAAKARQRRDRQRWIVSGSALVLVLVLVAALLGSFATSKSSSSPTTAPDSSSTTGALASARGKPCVNVADPLPTGAPAVPVQTGSPPPSLLTKDLTVGTGAVVKAGQTLSVDYIGVACSTGKIFDSSYSRGQPASFPLTGVIPGWQNGIPGMKVGGSRLLGIPPADGYGTAGSPPDIGPDETLWFVVHVISAK